MSFFKKRYGEMKIHICDQRLNNDDYDINELNTLFVECFDIHPDDRYWSNVFDFVIEYNGKLWIVQGLNDYRHEKDILKVPQVGLEYINFCPFCGYAPKKDKE